MHGQENYKIVTELFCFTFHTLIYCCYNVSYVTQQCFLSIFVHPPSTRDNAYFLTGKMIAVSVAHGGPGPHFLSRDLVNHIVGQPGFCANVKDVIDDEIKRALCEV